MTSIDSNGNIHHTKGDTFEISFSSVQIDGVDIVWTGCTAKLQVKVSANDTNAVVELTSPTDIDLTTNGEMTWTKAASYWNINAQTYCYDFQYTDANGVVNTFFSNKQFVIDQDVTR